MPPVQPLDVGSLEPTFGLVPAPDDLVKNGVVVGVSEETTIEIHDSVEIVVPISPQVNGDVISRSNHQSRSKE